VKIFEVDEVGGGVLQVVEQVANFDGERVVLLDNLKGRSD
jgi:hypothetical protein